MSEEGAQRVTKLVRQGLHTFLPFMLLNAAPAQAVTSSTIDDAEWLKGVSFTSALMGGDNPFTYLIDLNM